jgi:hypothetical protein
MPKGPPAYNLLLTETSDLIIKLFAYFFDLTYVPKCENIVRDVKKSQYFSNLFLKHSLSNVCLIEYELLSFFYAI